MAAAKKIAKRKVAKKAKPGVARAAKKTAKTARQKPGTGASSPSPQRAPSPPAVSGQNVEGLRVRMFRVGFGDFFLLTVPTAQGDRHILIDCGVHAKALGSIQDAVRQMASDCGNELALRRPQCRRLDP